MRVALRVRARGPGGSTAVHDVLATVGDEGTAGDVRRALARHLGAPDETSLWIERTRQVVPDETPIRGLQLRDGDLLGLQSAGSGTLGSPSPASGATAEVGAAPKVELAVVGGPDAGRRLDLGIGSTVVGRDPGCDLALSDDTVSRRHLEIRLTEEVVEVADLGATNGTFVDGTRISGVVRLRDGQMIEAGSSLLQVQRHASREPAHLRWADGALGFNRPPRVTPPRARATITIPQPPDRPRKTRLPLAASVVPVAFGLLMYVVLQQLTFLLFCAMGPLMAFWSVMEDRRSGRKDYRGAVRQFEEELEATAAHLRASHEAEIEERRAASLPATELLGWVETTSPRLWERRPTDSDFLDLRIGVADLPADLDIEVPARGDPDLLARCAALEHEHRVDPNVPVVLHARAVGTSGIVGSPQRVAALARWLVIQGAVLQSPRDLGISVFVPQEQAAAWEWVKWLPHVDVLSHDSVSIAVDQDEHVAMLDHLNRLIARRTERTRLGAMAEQRFAPEHLVVVLDAGELPRASLASALAIGPEAGVNFICVAADAASLPGECRSVIDVGDASDDLSLTLTGEGSIVRRAVADGLSREDAAAAALGIAGLRDVGARQAGGELPERVALSELTDSHLADPVAMLARWTSSSSASDLDAIIGAAETGPFEIDIRRHGPHALVAGTTGAGKSELLQTLVSSLASRLPPTRMTFLLIDYKGGLAFKDCVELPHVVGFVTDLDGHLAQRALVSLNAELTSREELFRKADTNSLSALERQRPELAPPTLVIVIDEFATLASEIPDFVPGVLNVAQRGRSLGVHLILATQRPAGVVTDPIRANTNLRICLRVTDETESLDVVGVADAAHFPTSLPGRALVRTGHGDVALVQSAFVGGQVRGEAQRHDIAVVPFTGRFGARGGPADGSGDGTSDALGAEQETELQAIVGSARGVVAQLGLEPPRRPWLPPLPELITTEALLAPGTNEPGLVAPLGLVDEPDRQRQSTYCVDLELMGNLLVLGAAGSGKTTALMTIAAELASRYSPERVIIYGAEFAGAGLRPLEALPHCGSIVNGSDVERVERLVGMLESTLDDRQHLLAATGAGSITELRTTESAVQPPDLVVLFDGYGAFYDTFERVDHGELVDRFARLVADGRSAGIHLIVTADRRSGLPLTITGFVSDRVVLRLADEDEYAWLGLAAQARGTRLPAGRGFATDGRELQIAVQGGPTGAEQGRSITALAEMLNERYATATVATVDLLRDDIDRSTLVMTESRSPMSAVLGLEGRNLSPRLVDFDDQPTLLIAGPDGMGRSTTLRSLVVDLTAEHSELPAFLLAPRRTPLTDAIAWTDRAHGLDECEQLAVSLRERLDDESVSPILLVVDDGEELTEGRAAQALEAIVRRSRDGDVVVIAAAQSHQLHRIFGGWLNELRKAKHGLILCPDVDIDGDIFGVRLPRKSARSFPPGRGYFVRRGSVELVQVAR